jgi:hypothetical protein
MFASYDGVPTRFGRGDCVQHRITGIPSLTCQSFDFDSYPAGGRGPYRKAAHVQGISVSPNSGWVTVPEPASMALLSLMGMGMRRRR